MKTMFNFEGKNLYTPIAFRSDFNQFAPLSATQAWSMFFTASREDTALGFDARAGQFWNNLLLAVVASGILGVLIFQSF
ncbi:hypothetical protein [Pseudanabaena sp. PCC 6802]|uniref:hypothetical protein n=1 Tax=Pseudanabaena sp. PCC 6802 TaxID=118173 RepID=UPI00034A44CE|nr:hypothetical protein [Pseudanabaena sp. PCC 6802]